MPKRKSSSLALAVVVCAACAEGGPGLNLPSGPETREVRIFFDTPSVLVGDSVRAVAVGLFSRGVRLRSDGYPEQYSFALVDTSIATLAPAPLATPGSPATRVRGRSPGWAKLTATINGVTGVDSVHVLAR